MSDQQDADTNHCPVCGDRAEYRYPLTQGKSVRVPLGHVCIGEDTLYIHASGGVE